MHFKFIASLFIVLLLSFSKQSNAQDNCKDFEYHNYKEILKNVQGGLYKNPFEKGKCFILNFDKDDQSPIEKLSGNYESLQSYAFFYSTVEGMFVAHVKNKKENNHFNVFNFIYESDTDFYIKRIIRPYPVGKYYPDIIFLHEIFHLHHQGNEDYKIEEIKADIFATLIISMQERLSKEESIRLSDNFFYLRTNFLDSEFDKNDTAQSKYNKIKEFIYKDYENLFSENDFKSIGQKLIEL